LKVLKDCCDKDSAETAASAKSDAKTAKRTSIAWELLPATIDSLNEEQLVQLREDINKRNSDHPGLKAARDRIAK